MEKNQAAVELGRKGGKAKTKKPKGLAAQSPARRAEIAQMGLEKRRSHKGIPRVNLVPDTPVHYAAFPGCNPALPIYLAEIADYDQSVLEQLGIVLTESLAKLPNLPPVDDDAPISQLGLDVAIPQDERRTLTCARCGRLPDLHSSFGGPLTCNYEPLRIARPPA